MAYAFPKVDFGWLSALPDTAREAEMGRQRKATLADLQSEIGPKGSLTDASPASLERTAARLASIGDLEGFKVLQGAAQQQRTLLQKGEADRAYHAALQNIQKSGGIPGIGGTPAADVPQPPLELGTPPAARGAPAPSSAQQPFTGFPAPPAPRPQSALPAAGPQLAASPSEEILARAEGGGQQAPAGPQLAGPLPAPEAPGPLPPGLDPGTVAGALARPVIGGPGAPAPVQERRIPTELPPRHAEHRAEANAMANILAQLPRSAMSSPLARMALQRMNAATSEMKMSKEQQGYELERITRRQNNEPDISFAEYHSQLIAAPERIKEVGKLYVEQEKKAAQSSTVIANLDRMSTIVDDPNFMAGVDANKYVEGISRLAFIAKAVGQDPEKFTGKLKEITDPYLRAAALKQEFDSLANSAVLSVLGDTLGRQISDTDRKFIADMVAHAGQTPAGIRGIIGNLKSIAEHNRNAAKALHGYVKANENRLTEHGFYGAMRDYDEQNPLFLRGDGTPTDLGKKVTADIEKANAGAAKDVPKAAPTPSLGPNGRPQVAPGQPFRAKGPDGKEKTWVIGPSGQPEEVSGAM